MGSVEKISVALPPDMVVMLREAVASGEYGSASEVIREALRAWTFRRKVQSLSVQELRQLAREGTQSGEGVDADAVFARLRSKYEEMAKAKDEPE